MRQLGVRSVIDSVRAHKMAYAIGVVIGVLTFAVGRFAGFDRDRAFYPTILIITASYYVLFAVMGGSTSALVAELIGLLLFFATALAGFKLSPWILVAGLGGHAVFDLVHGYVVTNPGVPAYWPAFCLAFDVSLAAALAVLIRARAQQAEGARS